VRCPDTDAPPPALREACSNLGRSVGKGSRALLSVSVTIVDVVLSFGISWCWVGRLDMGSLTIDFFFRGSEIFNSLKITTISHID
jgi:hypothetical protein